VVEGWVGDQDFGRGDAACQGVEGVDGEAFCPGFEDQEVAKFVEEDGAGDG